MSLSNKNAGVGNYKSLVEGVVRRLRRHPSQHRRTKEEMVQEGLIAVWEALPKYSTGKEGEETSVEQYLTYAVGYALKKSTRETRRYQARNEALDEIEMKVAEDMSYQRWREEEGEESLSGDVDERLGSLPPVTRLVANLLSDGKPQREVAEELQISRNEVRRRVQALRLAMRGL